MAKMNEATAPNEAKMCHSEVDYDDHNVNIEKTMYIIHGVVDTMGSMTKNGELRGYFTDTVNRLEFTDQ